MKRTDEITAPDDKTIVFRLKQPFALLPDALGHGAPNMCAIMPERIGEPIRSSRSPKWSAAAHSDSRLMSGYQAHVWYMSVLNATSREGGAPDFTAGPKVAHFDRIEWRVIPDPDRCRRTADRRDRLVGIPTPICCPSCGRIASRPRRSSSCRSDDGAASKSSASPIQQPWQFAVLCSARSTRDNSWLR